MNDFYAKPITKDRLKTLYCEADEYRLFNNADPEKTIRFSSLYFLWQYLKFWQDKNSQTRA